MSMFTNEDESDKMSITTPVAGMDIGDIPTPMAEQEVTARPAHPFRPPAAPSDKRLQSWRIGPRYTVTSVIGRGSYGEVASAIDTVT